MADMAAVATAVVATMAVAITAATAGATAARRFRLASGAVPGIGVLATGARVTGAAAVTGAPRGVRAGAIGGRRCTHRRLLWFKSRRYGSRIINPPQRHLCPRRKRRRQTRARSNGGTGVR